MDKVQIIKSLRSIRNRINDFEHKIKLINATIDYIEDSIYDRIRNEDGESVFPLERPKTCTTIIKENINGKTEKLEICPTDILQGIKTRNPLTKQFGDLNEELFAETHPHPEKLMSVEYWEDYKWKKLNNESENKDI